MNSQTELPGLVIQQQSPEVHDFKESLEKANAVLTSEKLDEFYHKQFPRVKSVEKVTNLTLQRQGIDTKVTTTNGKQYYFDEKVRFKDYGDILLEEYSVWIGYPYARGVHIRSKETIPQQIRATMKAQQALKLGWINGDKRTDYITYIIRPTGSAYLIPFLLLQRAWEENYHSWLHKYGRLAANNGDYHTTNIAIPTNILYEALYELVGWQQLTLTV